LTAILLSIVIFSGVQIALIGIVGEYMAIFDEVKGRPLYLVTETITCLLPTADPDVLFVVQASRSPGGTVQECADYVQFIHSRRGEPDLPQCNIIYANSDVRECGIDEVERIADNFVELGVAMVLLTGASPSRDPICRNRFARSSSAAFMWYATNGRATEEEIQKVSRRGPGHFHFARLALAGHAGRDQRRLREVLA